MPRNPDATSIIVQTGGGERVVKYQVPAMVHTAKAEGIIARCRESRGRSSIGGLTRDTNQGAVAVKVVAGSHFQQTRDGPVKGKRLVL